MPASFITRLKSTIARFWPALRLRTIIFGTLLFTASLPGFGALFLRVYENALLRQTEAELVAQSAVLVATAQTLANDHSPIIRPASGAAAAADHYRPEMTTLDLRAANILPPRPRAQPVKGVGDNINLAPISNRLAAIMANSSKTTLASIQLVDSNRIIRIGYEAGQRYEDVDELEVALQGRPITVLRRNAAYRPRYALEWLSRASNLRLHHARPLMINRQIVGAILVTRSPRALFRGLYEDRGKILFGIAAIFGLLVVISAILARAIVKPVERLSAAARNVTAGRGTIPDDPSLPVIEIDQLYQNFREMAVTIERRSHYLRDLAAAVSHEFKTPLTGIRGAVEVMEDHEATISPAERRQFLQNINHDAQRLSHLVDRLMKLAKADMQLPDDHSEVDVKAAMLKVIDGFSGEEYGVTADWPDDFLLAQSDINTVELITTILLENSVQAGASSMTISARTDGADIIIEFADDGPGIPAADEQNIFHPFFTSKRSTGGTGLGLAIARSLITASKGHLTLVPSQLGACFRVRLLRARGLTG